MPRNAPPMPAHADARHATRRRARVGIGTRAAARCCDGASRRRRYYTLLRRRASPRARALIADDYVAKDGKTRRYSRHHADTQLLLVTPYCVAADTYRMIRCVGAPLARRRVVTLWLCTRATLWQVLSQEECLRETQRCWRGREMDKERHAAIKQESVLLACHALIAGLRGKAPRCTLPT